LITKILCTERERKKINIEVHFPPRSSVFLFLVKGPCSVYEQHHDSLSFFFLSTDSREWKGQKSKINRNRYSRSLHLPSFVSVIKYKHSLSLSICMLLLDWGIYFFIWHYSCLKTSQLLLLLLLLITIYIIIVI